MTTIALTRQDRQAAHDLLEKTRRIIDRGWTQGALARDVYGWPVDPDQESAVCWCLGGALLAAADLASLDELDSENRFTRPAWVAEGALERVGNPIDAMETFNDSAMSVYEVHERIDRAQAWLLEETT